ncbi:MAG: thioredoxin domain-containing protein [Lentilactobacillus diolivorans]
MSEFNFNFSDQSTLNFGEADADHELTAILNLACPDSRKWFLENGSILLNSVGTGQLRLHLKFWNKPKPSLLNGNVANGYVDYDHPNQAFDFVTRLFQHQEQLRNQALENVELYLRDTFNVQPYELADEVAKQILAEVNQNNITSVPTIITNNRSYFDDGLIPVSQLF